jgi:hypothetical protein
MEDILDEPEILQKNNMFFTIWTKTTDTFKYILKNCPKKYVRSIIIWYGVSNAIDINLQMASIRHRSYSMSIIIAGSLLGWLVSWLIVYINAALMSWTGKWIGGRADTKQFITVSAWSLIPAICSVFPFSIQAILYNSVPISHQNVIMKIFYAPIRAVRIVLGIWSIVIFVKGTAVLQDFTIRKAILNTFLALLIIAVPVISLLAFNFFS